MNSKKTLPVDFKHRRVSTYGCYTDKKLKFAFANNFAKNGLFFDNGFKILLTYKYYLAIKLILI